MVSVKSPEFPFIGVLSDGLVNCKCCGEGCLEIKCQFCHKDECILEAADQDKRFCLKKNNSNELCLNKQHSYFCHIQTQLYICKRSYCDLYLWTTNDYHIESIFPDPRFCEDCIAKCTKFF